MLKHYAASRFIRTMSSGRNVPALLACDKHEVIAKCSGCECGSLGLVREALAAMLARDLGLPVPEPCLVEISPEFIAALPVDETKLRDVMSASVNPAFGSTRLPDGFSLWVADREIRDEMLEQAAEIFAFDALILNGDRRVVNPNCQARGAQFAIFDHELCLDAATVGSFLQPAPWQPGSLSAVMGGPGEHLLFRGIRTRKPSLERLESSWSKLTPAHVDAYESALPKSWLSQPESVTNALKYLKDLLDHLEPCFEEVRRVLA